eukprot:8264105-Pyramimonas_sp.AAC.1
MVLLQQGGAFFGLELVECEENASDTSNGVNLTNKYDTAKSSPAGERRQSSIHLFDERLGRLVYSGRANRPSINNKQDVIVTPALPGLLKV